jgi:hypothetical protein
VFIHPIIVFKGLGLYCLLRHFIPKGLNCVWFILGQNTLFHICVAVLLEGDLNCCTKAFDEIPERIENKTKQWESEEELRKHRILRQDFRIQSR